MTPKAAEGTQSAPTDSSRQPAPLDSKATRLDAYLQDFDLTSSPLTPEISAIMAHMLDQIDHLKNEVEKARAEAERHERLAHEDAFMPIGNRRAFVRELTRLIALAKRHHIVSSVVYIDMNGMKLINDRFGHNAGDAALMLVARTLCNQVRESDIVARLGGDEFGVLLVRTDGPAADSKAEALAEAIASTPLVWDNTSVPMRAAFGTYAITGDETVASALEAADQAMYRCKKRLSAARER